MPKVDKQKKQKMAHIIAAFIILVHAYEKYDAGESSYVFFGVAGIVFLGIALLHHRLLKQFPYADGFFFVIEAMVYAVIAADYFQRGKKALPWCYVVTAIAYIIVAFIKGKKGQARHTDALKFRDREINEEER